MSRTAKPQNGRRRFLRDVVRTAGGLAAVGVALGLQQQTARASGVRLRPPGALNENVFASACVRCGQCVQACPYDTLKLATLASGLSAGTPYFVARDIPCEMCEDIPCAKVCPSGALNKDIASIDDSRMGLAVLLDQENCLNFQGLRCDVCYRECPKIDEAITLELDRNMRTGKHARFLPNVHSDACTGCGKCEKVCVLEQPAIKVLPLSLAKGELGHHYRFGWLEGKDGKS
ncbi:ferredoxin-type protein NapG [Salmonella enterica subsp. enterica serovar Typhimurium]|uniref:Ferredoxin-type protein NapG n=1 Tax=Salmonella typhimurium TaxID=90371 RepID=A0A5X8W1H8_SALTM|nr:ferredoxin-type protein NapG [Salmonella enterica subsp. enterica serovar Typhimurium]EBX3989982.1 ferredoxin-type protein NapG [Salmonella enterica subsp. enterica serovar Typhimurium]ECB1640404.1 ferredoxin-type protein NapG [Salmonella enterica subsp. enterica serovar Typhimurium]ECB2154581.1 ferredoxin-type protein NapG [Salmonella enterica subsp. enterica serovar Typhimurium]ECD2716818.1 ferredoxin-type protein NapG [Salmonella enterica subsp. enterica serovar Typhimurium]